MALSQQSSHTWSFQGLANIQRGVDCHTFKNPLKQNAADLGLNQSPTLAVLMNPSHSLVNEVELVQCLVQRAVGKF
jgi:hypothetical protein